MGYRLYFSRAGPIIAGVAVALHSPFRWGLLGGVDSALANPVSDHAPLLRAGSNEYTARAMPWSLLVTSGLASGYLDLADKYEAGAKANSRPGPPGRCRSSPPSLRGSFCLWRLPTLRRKPRSGTGHPVGHLPRGRRPGRCRQSRADSQIQRGQSTAGHFFHGHDQDLVRIGAALFAAKNERLREDDDLVPACPRCAQFAPGNVGDEGPGGVHSAGPETAEAVSAIQRATLCEQRHAGASFFFKSGTQVGYYSSAKEGQPHDLMLAVRSRVPGMSMPGPGSGRSPANQPGRQQ